MVAKSSTSKRSVCWNVVFDARAGAPGGGPSPGSMLIDSINSPVPVLSLFLLCSSGVLISSSSLVFRLINLAKVTSLSPLYTGNVSVQSQTCLRVTQSHHKNGQALVERWEQLFTIAGNRNGTERLLVAFLGNCASSLMKGKLMATKKHEAGGTTSYLTSPDSLGQSTCAPTGPRIHFAQQ